jgi:hypothetical protein
VGGTKKLLFADLRHPRAGPSEPVYRNNFKYKYPKIIKDVYCNLKKKDQYKMQMFTSGSKREG